MPNPFRSRDAEEMPNAIVGAARRIHLNRRHEVEKLRETHAAEWQKHAWRYYDEIGEVKFAFNYFAAISSRVRIFPGHQAEDEEAPGPVAGKTGLNDELVRAAKEEIGALNKGRGGQPNLIRQLALNLLVTGEAYLVGYGGSWSIKSTSELDFDASGRIKLITSARNRGARNNQYLPEDAYVARIWRTHPQYSDDADSSLRGVMRDCSELLLLGRLINASVGSRLNAGILYVADELRFQRAVGADDGAQPDVDPFEEELTMSLTEPIDDTEAPSNIIPMIIRGPAGLSENAIRKIDLSRGFDETIVKRHDQTLERILDGIDVPRDVIKGLANVRYSNAQTISEDMLKAHVEPLMVLLCEALTTVYLRPKLLDRGFSPEEVAQYHVWYDPSEVVTRPDRSEDADKGYDRKLISGAAWRRAHGFNEADAPSDDEVALRVALEGQVTADITLEFLRRVSPDLVAEAEALVREAAQPPATGDPSGDRSPDYVPVPNRPNADPPPSNPQGGTMPPRENSAAVMEMLRSFASKRQSDVVKQRAKSLSRALEVERRLRDQLFVLLNETVQRSLEKAGARTVSKVRGDSELKSLVADAPMESVFAFIPEDRRTEFALDEEQLVRDSLEKARPAYVDLVTRLQETGWRALGVDMKPQQADRVERSWTWLLDQLTTVAVKWLRSPKSRAGAYVDMASVRTAAAIAGGDEANPSGRAVLSNDALAATGWRLGDRKQWVYGISDNSFEPHISLDGVMFDSWESSELAVSDPTKFPFVPFLYPGDHNGCRCDWLPEVLEPEAAESARELQITEVVRTESIDVKQLKDYWLYGDGRAMWNSHEELTRHLANVVDPTTAERIATEWVDERYGANRD